MMIGSLVVTILASIFLLDYKVVEKRARKKAERANPQGAYTTTSGATMLKVPTVIPTLCDELEKALHRRYKTVMLGLLLLITGIIIFDVKKGIPLSGQDFSVYIIGYVFFAAIFKKAIDKVYASRIGIINAGAEGEVELARHLATLPKGYTILCDINIPRESGTTSQVDGIVFGPTGIFVIEAKNISGVIEGAEQSNTWIRNTQSNAGNWYQKDIGNPVKQNIGHIHAAKDYLQRELGYTAWFNSIVVFTGDTKLKVQAEKVAVLNINQVVDYICNFQGRNVNKKNLQPIISAFKKLA